MSKPLCRLERRIRRGIRWFLFAVVVCLAGRVAATEGPELKANMLLNRSVFLSWTEVPEETFGRYELYAGAGRGEEALPERPVAVFDEASHSYLSLRGLEPETEYAVQVRLVPADGGEAIRSGVVQFTTLKDGDPSGRSPVDTPVPTFMYHHVRPLEAFPPGWYSTENFERDLKWMKEHNIHTVTSADILDGRLPENPIYLTFDDGYTDFLEYAVPLLVKYGFTAANAIVTQGTGGQSTWDISATWPLDNMMTWPQIRECLKQGMEIGGHTQTHVNLHDSPGQVGQVAGSYRDIVSALGFEPLYFCYPWGMGGHKDQNILNAVEKAGYRLATRTWPPGRAHLWDDFYFFPRQFANQDDTLADFVVMAGFALDRGPMARLGFPLDRMQRRLMHILETMP